MKTTLTKIWNILSGAAVVLVVVLAVVLMGGRLLGWQAFSVVSGSMRPTYNVGDLIYVKTVDPQKVRAGDVITFVMNEQLVVGTHRVVEVEQTAERLYYHTKGDANDTVDAAAVAQENLVGVPVFSVPMLGYVANYVQNPPGCYVAVAVCAALLTAVFLPDLFGGKKRRQQQQLAQQEAIQAAVEKALAEERAKNTAQQPRKISRS